MLLRHIFDKKLLEGGNLAAGQPGWKGSPEAGRAQQINLQVTNRNIIVPILNDLLKSIDFAYKNQYQENLWNPKLLKSQKFLSGSSLHFFNVKDIPDDAFLKKKPKVGDIDTMVSKEKESNLESFLDQNIDKKIGPAKLLGFQRGNEQFSSLWELTDPPIKIQIDLEFVQFDQDEPTDWARFSHSSDWNDIQAGVKGVFHKYLIQSFAVLTKRQFILRKQEGRGKNRQWVDVPEEDSLLGFAVSSKEGGGLRAKYTPVLNPSTNEPEMKDGLPVMLKLPAVGYEQNINKIFMSLFGVKMSEKAAEKLTDKFWSFTGLLDVMNKLLEPEEKSRVLGSFLQRTFGPGAQGLYKNEPERDSAEKMIAIDLLINKTGAEPPEGINLDQMRQEYVQAYKMTEEVIDEENDPTAPPKPNYARQGIQHIYNRLPDGRVSSMEMKDADFIELCKEIADNGGTLDNIAVNLKVDGAGIRFGKDESGRAFFMTSKVTTPLYKDNVGYFTNFGIEKGQSDEQLARTKNYDNALSLIVNSDFIETLPPDTIVQAEMLYNPMAEDVDGQLKFVNIPYDPKKLGKQMTLVPFMAKKYSTGEPLPNEDKIIQKLVSSSSGNIKIITNNLEQKGINVSKIIDPVINLDPNLIAALKARGTNPQKEQAKQILDQARQELSNAIIDSPKLKGKNILGDNMEGIVINMPSGRLVKVTSQSMKSAMAAKLGTGQTFGDTKKRTAVVAIGNFAGHRGHEELIDFAIKKANEVGGSPFIFVGKKVGPDDPIDLDTKVETLKKLFPNVPISVVRNQIDATGTETEGNIFKKIEYELVKKEPFYNDIVIAVGSDQAGIAKTAEQMQNRYSKFPPLSHVKVSAYITPRGTGVSTTNLRNALKTMPEDQAFKVWSQAYNVEKLGADWIQHLMDIARTNMNLPAKPIDQKKSDQPIQERLFNALIRSKKNIRQGVAEGTISYDIKDDELEELYKKSEEELKEIPTRYFVRLVPRLGRKLQSMPSEERKRAEMLMTIIYSILLQRPDFPAERAEYHKDLLASKKKDVAEGIESNYQAALYIDEFGDGDHWYVKGAPDTIKRFVQLANSLEDEAVKGTEYEPGVGAMAKIHKQLGNDQPPQWKIVSAQNLEQLQPIDNKTLAALSRADLSNGAQEFMTDLLWNLESNGQAVVHGDSQQGVAEGGFSSRTTQATVVTPAIVRAAKSKIDNYFISDLNQWLRSKGMIENGEEVKPGKITGSGAHHGTDPQDTIYGDIDMQIVVPDLYKGELHTTGERQYRWKKIVLDFIKETNPEYLDSQASLDAELPVVKLDNETFIQVDLMPHPQKYSQWGKYRATAEQGITGLLNGNLFAVLSELLTVNLQHSGVQYKTAKTGGLRQKFESLKKGQYDLGEISYDVETFVLDILKDEHQAFGQGELEIDPLLERYPGVQTVDNIEDLRIQPLVNAIKGLARSFELNDLYGKGNLSKFSSAEDFIQKFKKLYALKANYAATNKKFDKAETPELKAHVQRKQEKIHNGLEYVMMLFDTGTNAPKYLDWLKTKDKSTTENDDMSGGYVKHKSGLGFQTYPMQGHNKEFEEEMLPKKAFAGTGAPHFHKLGTAAQAKGKQKGPVKRGQLVGYESANLVPLDKNIEQIMEHFVRTIIINEAIRYKK